MRKSSILNAAVATVVFGLAFSAQAADVTGAGASFIYPVMTKWSSDYNKATGKQVNYQSIGSGGGIAQIKAGTVDFGSSDAPLKPEELEKHGLAQFPSVIGGVVPVVHVKGIESGAMKLDGETLAGIFLGKVKKWNDPAIAALNGGLPLPDKKITVVHRSDGSGTTFNFVNYLSKVSPEWQSKVGEGTSVKWPTGIGGKGNEGVAAYVKQIDGGIGYVELSNAPGENSWPITATNFILMYKQPKNAATAKNAREFFRWVYANGDDQAKALDYVPLPDELVQQIEAYWSQNMAY